MPQPHRMPASRAILLDSNAGAPLHPFVVEALLAFLNPPSFLGNPSSLHSFGREAASVVDSAKISILQSLHADPAEWKVTFTSGGTEANRLGIRGVLESALDSFRAGKGARPGWFVSATEHACVLDLIEPMKRAGVLVSIIPVKKNGEVEIDPKELTGATLVSVIGVNNETGRIQPSYLDGTLTSHILRGNPATPTPILQTDYVAGWGKTKLDLSTAGAPDLVAIAGHKLGALSGIGALIHRKKLRLGVLRTGTENLLGIFSMRALTNRWEEVTCGIQGLSLLRDRFEQELTVRVPKVAITHSREPRAPHLSHFSFPGLSRSLSLVEQLDLRGFAVSAGSACASHTIQPSHVLLAMGFTRTDALNSLRVSLHSGNKWEDLDGLITALESILKRNEAI